MAIFGFDKKGEEIKDGQKEVAATLAVSADVDIALLYLLENCENVFVDCQSLAQSVDLLVEFFFEV